MAPSCRLDIIGRRKELFNVGTPEGGGICAWQDHAQAEKFLKMLMSRVINSINKLAPEER